jgi:hypothetical protein
MQELSEYDEGHIVVDFSSSKEDWKTYCTECWEIMVKDLDWHYGKL